MGKKTVIIISLFCAIAFGQNSNGLSPIVKSFLLPGWGEYTLEKPNRGRIFILSETALWTSFAGALIVSNNYTDLFQAYAADYAGVETSGKDRQFWVDVGNYESLNGHNEEHLRFRDYDAIYPMNSEWHWEWTSEEKRLQYRDYRVASDTWALGAKFIAGSIVMNHIVSAIDALYLQRISQIEAVSMQPLINMENGYSGLTLAIQF
ncbi:MAG TPA: hypothetical protein EYO13_00770 [Candidatus Marinimicrobia bacterium]|nr:hypothetical protein [Candidatus Neomarinimicrobiota bacterium]